MNILRKFRQPISWAFGYIKKYPVVFLVVLAVMTHIQWFNPGSSLMYSDWRNRDNTSAQDTLNFSRGTWIGHENLGQQNIQLYTYIPTILWGIVGNYDLAVKIGYLWPIAILSLLTPFYLIRYLFKRTDVALLSALFYGFSSYMIILGTNHLPIAVVCSIAPLLLLLFIRLRDAPSYKSTLLFAGLFSLGCMYELRIMLLVSIILAVYTAFNLKIMKEKWLYVAAGLILGFNLFWIIPLLLSSGVGGSIGEVANRGVFGNDLFTLGNGLAFSAWRWTGGLPVKDFISQPIQAYLWVFPLIACIGLVQMKSMTASRRRLGIFFLIILVIGLLFGKQADDPLPQLYEWFYDNVPGFNLFREASKYYLLIGIGYLGLVALSIAHIFNDARLKKYAPVVVAVVVIPICLMVAPLITSSIGTLYVSRERPQEYTQFSQKILHDPQQYRTLWLPRSTTWGVFNDLHPRIDAAAAGESFWKEMIDSLPGSASISPTLDLIQSKFGQDALNSASVRYVIVPLRDAKNDDDFFKAYGDDRQYYINSLDTIPWLKKVDLGTKGDLAVYENQTYEEHVYAFSSLDTYTSTDDFIRMKEEIGNLDNKDSDNFRIMKENEPSVGRGKRDIFSGVTTENLTKNGLNRQLDIATSSTLFYQQKATITYEVENNVVTFYRSYPGTISFNGQYLGKPNTRQAIRSFSLNDASDYFLTDKTKALTSLTSKTGKYLGVQDEEKLIVTDSANLIHNGSFENGPWHAEVDDCNNYDQQARIAMSINEDEHTEGMRSLRLSSRKHTACTTSNSIDVSGSDKYLLRLDYYLKNTDEVQYEVEYLPSGKKQTYRKTEKTGLWNSDYEVIDIPEGDSTAKIRLLGLPNQHGYNREATTLYDNVRFTKISEMYPFGVSDTTAFEKTDIAAGTHTFAYANDEYDYKNKIPNGSLEKGLWRDKVSDCHAYDNQPDLKMGLSDAASDGKKALELSAKKHIACTGPGDVDVDENATYLLSFDYKVQKGGRANYNIGFNDSGRTSVSDTLRATQKWQTYSRLIEVPSGATTLNLLVYAYADQFGFSYISSYYDNFKLIKVPNLQNQFYIFEKEKTYSKPREVNYEFVNSTKERAHLKGVTTSFYLAMSEAYNPQWILTLKGKGDKTVEVSKDSHFTLNNTINGWLIDVDQYCIKQGVCELNPDGSYSIEAEFNFKPQSLFYVGLVISGVFVGGSIVAYRILYKRREGDDE